MELRDCEVNELGLPKVPFAITTAKREQWRLWLFRKILAGEITATEADLARWYDDVEVRNPGPEQFDSVCAVGTHSPNKLHSHKHPESVPPKRAHVTHMSRVETSEPPEQEAWWKKY